MDLEKPFKNWSKQEMEKYLASRGFSDPNYDNLKDLQDAVRKELGAQKSVKKKAKLIQSLEKIQKALAVEGFHQDAAQLGQKIVPRKNFIAATFLGVPAEELGAGRASAPVRALVCEIAATAAAKDAHEIKDILVNALREEDSSDDYVIEALMKTKMLVVNE